MYVVLIILSLVIGISLIIFFLSFIVPTVTGAPYVVSQNDRLQKMLALANIKPGEKAVDLGSGDGKIVIALAKAGAVAYGYELNPVLALLAKWKIYKAGLKGKAFVFWKNFLNVDLSQFDLIFVYTLPGLMAKLEKKLEAEAKPGSRVVSNHFQFPNKKPAKQDGEILLYQY